MMVPDPPELSPGAAVNSELQFPNDSRDVLDAFRARHASGPFLSLNPLYALPPSLVDALLAESRDWFSAEELFFEEDLYNICNPHNSLGFFHGRFVFFNSWNRPRFPQFAEELLQRLHWDQFWTPAKANLLAQTSTERAGPLHEMLEAYCGWLVMNPRYRRELNALQARWSGVIDQIGGFPNYPVRASPDEVEVSAPPGRDVTDQIVSDFNKFYDRWELLGLVTWDLPQPRGANWSGIPYPPSVAQAPSTLAFQTSPILNLPANFPLRDIVAEAQRSRIAEHLEGWQQVVQQKHPADLRFVSFRRILFLHFYRDTVLHSRYADRFAGQVEALDRAFGRFLDGLSSDSVKKLRQEMKKLLEVNV